MPRFQFEDYVLAHLERRAAPNSVSRRRIFSCAECGNEIPEAFVQAQRARGNERMPCPGGCDVDVSLLDREERLTGNRCPQATGSAWAQGMRSSIRLAGWRLTSRVRVVAR